MSEASSGGGFSRYECEKEVLGFTHAELSADALAEWNLPEEIGIAVRYHHEPDLAPAPEAAIVSAREAARTAPSLEVLRARDTVADVLAGNIERWDTGYWSLYDLFPHPLPNVASGAYHALHITQLNAMQLIDPRPEYAAAIERFERYSHSAFNRALQPGAAPGSWSRP